MPLMQACTGAEKPLTFESLKTHCKYWIYIYKKKKKSSVAAIK